MNMARGAGRGGGGVLANVFNHRQPNRSMRGNISTISTFRFIKMKIYLSPVLRFGYLCFN